MKRARFVTTIVVAVLTAAGLLPSGVAAQTRSIPRVASPVLQKHSSVKDRAIYEKMVLPGIHPDGEVNVASIREALDAFKATAEVKPDVDLDKMLDLSFVKYAQEILGRYER